MTTALKIYEDKLITPLLEVFYPTPAEKENKKAEIYQQIITNLIEKLTSQFSEEQKQQMDIVKDSNGSLEEKLEKFHGIINSLSVAENIIKEYYENELPEYLQNVVLKHLKTCSPEQKQAFLSLALK